MIYAEKDSKISTILNFILPSLQLPQFSVKNEYYVSQSRVMVYIAYA